MFLSACQQVANRPWSDAPESRFSIDGVRVSGFGVLGFRVT